jgi:hypothetical protein
MVETMLLGQIVCRYPLKRVRASEEPKGVPEVKKYVQFTIVVTAFVILMAPKCWAVERIGTDGMVCPDSLDFQKAGAHEETCWVKHACWPAAETLTSLRYGGDVAPERNDLVVLLQKVLQEDYRPMVDDIQSKLVPVTGLWDGADYLLLKYTARNKLEVSLQDGTNLFVIVAVADGNPSSDIEALVRVVAKSTLDLSQAPAEYRENPKVWTWPIEIGKSSSGQLRCGMSPETGLPDWFTSIPWWSDGKRVMFFISKFDYSKLPGLASKPEVKPRVFKSRSQGQKP